MNKVITKPITILLPEEWKQVAKDHHGGVGPFNYSNIIREAIYEHFEKNGWVER
jgi:hypothetical protein